MPLNLVKKESVIYAKEGTELFRLANSCSDTLVYDYGIPLEKGICYLVNKGKGKYQFYYSLKDLGFVEVANPTSELEELFVQLIHSVEKETQGSFHAVVFSSHVPDFPYPNKFLVFKREECFYEILDWLDSRVKVLAWNQNNIPCSLSNFTFQLNWGSYESRSNYLKEMIIENGSSAKRMAEAVNMSKAGYINWKPLEDNLKRHVIGVKDTLGNKYYIALIL